MKFLIILAFSGLLACAAGSTVSKSHNELSISPSTLLKNAKMYDGKIVRVHGYAVITSHAQNIYDSSASYSSKRFNKCVGLSEPNKTFIHQYREGYEEFVGTFHAAL